MCVCVLEGLLLPIRVYSFMHLLVPLVERFLSTPCDSLETEAAVGMTGIINYAFAVHNKSQLLDCTHYIVCTCVARTAMGGRFGVKAKIINKLKCTRVCSGKKSLDLFIYLFSLFFIYYRVNFENKICEVEDEIAESINLI